MRKEKVWHSLLIWLLIGNLGGQQLWAQVDQTNTSNALPQPEEYDKCFSKATMPDQYEWVDVQQLVKEAYIKTVEIPAEYEMVEEQVLVKEASIELITIPPVYKTISEDVLIKEASNILKEQYENIVENVMVQPAYGEWLKIDVDPNCFSPNPEDCYIMRWQEVPADYDTISQKILTQVSNTDQEIPAEYVTLSKRIMVEPARVVEREIPAEYKTVKKRVLINPAKTEEILIPAEYKTVQEKQLLKEGGEIKWVEILCPDNISTTLIRQLQLALYAKGYKPGVIDGYVSQQTKVALYNFQKEEGLPLGNLNKDTMLALGLTF